MVLKFGFPWSKTSLGDLHVLDCINRISSSIFVSALMTLAIVEAFGIRRAVFCGACCRSTGAAFSRITTNGSAAATLLPGIYSAWRDMKLSKASASCESNFTSLRFDFQANKKLTHVIKKNLRPFITK